MQACADVFFDELRNPALTLPEGRPLPPLFNFYPEGMDHKPLGRPRFLLSTELAACPSIAEKLKPRA